MDRSWINAIKSKNKIKNWFIWKTSKNRLLNMSKKINISIIDIKNMKNKKEKKKK